MTDWFSDKKSVMEITELEIMAELSLLLKNPKIDDCANYWIDNTHNVYVCVLEDDGDLWIEAKMELYDNNGELLGNLEVYCTTDISRKSLVKVVKEIVKDYYME